MRGDARLPPAEVAGDLSRCLRPVEEEQEDPRPRRVRQAVEEGGERPPRLLRVASQVLTSRHIEKLDRLPDRVDLLILGSGATAFAAALRAAELSKTALMIESRTLGGTCVNRGCLPSKDLIEAARISWEAAHPRYPGLSPATLGLDFRTLVRGQDEVVRSYRDGKYASIVSDSDKIALASGRALRRPAPCRHRWPQRQRGPDPHRDGDASRHPAGARPRCCPLPHQRPPCRRRADGAFRAASLAPRPGRRRCRPRARPAVPPSGHAGHAAAVIRARPPRLRARGLDRSPRRAQRRRRQPPDRHARHRRRG